MTLQELGNIGELVAALATLATLAYLAYELYFNLSQQGLLDKSIGDSYEKVIRLCTAQRGELREAALGGAAERPVG